MALIFLVSQPWLWMSMAQSQKLLVKRQQEWSLMELSAISHFFPKSSTSFAPFWMPSGSTASSFVQPLKEKQLRKPSLSSKTAAGAK